MEEKPRLIVLTDISSLTAGVAEPDDGQSLIRLLLYSNELEIEGLIASSNLGHGQKVQPELIRTAIHAYEQVRPNLLLHRRDYPAGDDLLKLVNAGQPVAGPKVDVFDSIGAGRDTEASEWIVQVVDRPGPRPVWVTIWGGSADLAQALWKVRRTRDEAGVREFVSRLRVHSVYDQDSTGAWIKENFSALFVITRHHGIRGMYRGGDMTLVSPEWVETNIRRDHGALGALYPNYDGGDIWSSRLGRVRGIKEGDTPSFLSLIPHGLSEPSEPSWGSWGGRWEGAAGRYTDTRDADVVAADDPDPRMSAVYRWRPAFQADFQARLDWCVKPLAEANHPPVARIRGELRRTVRPGEVVTLDARESSDPDGDSLAFHWSLYPPPEGDLASLSIGDSSSAVAHLIVPQVTAPRTIPILLTVTDSGEPRLTRYQRLVLDIEAPTP